MKAKELEEEAIPQPSPDSDHDKGVFMDTMESTGFCGHHGLLWEIRRENGVANGTRTRNNKLHKLGLYH